MNYILNEAVGLRSWKQLPYAYIRKGKKQAGIISKRDFELLLKCDGKTQIEESDVLDLLIKKDLCKKAENGERLTEWQKLKTYENIYYSTLSIRITGKCNFNCKHCFNAADINKDTSEWSMPEMIKLLDEAKEYGIQSIILTGGEPTLHPHFIDIVKEIYARDMWIDTVVTNAHFITQEMLDEMHTCGAYPKFRISFDGLGCHDWMRGQEGAEKTALEKIKLCHDNGHIISINCQLNNITQDSILKTAKYFDEMGIETFRIIRTTETPRWEKYGGKAFISIEDYFDKCVDFLREYAKEEHTMNIICWEFVKAFEKNKIFLPNALKSNTKSFHAFNALCTTCRFTPALGSNGTLYPCHQCSGVLDSTGMKMPDVKKEGLNKALENKDYIAMAHENANDLASKSVECGSCRHFKQCYGGCRQVAFLLTKSFTGPDPYQCTFFKGDYENKLKASLPGWCIAFPSEEAEYDANDYNELVKTGICEDEIE